MDPKALYWTGALANMGVVLAIFLVGVRKLRSGDVAGHRRTMSIGAALIVAFLISYVLKVVLLGREDLATWSQLDRVVLWIHEACVTVVLLAGGVAAWRGRALARTRSFTRSPEDPVAPARVITQHRAAGKTALLAVGLGFLTASLVLLGMYRRAGIV
jgi:uncharacterized membrane protein YozB (DUF420 family)